MIFETLRTNGSAVAALIKVAHHAAADRRSIAPVKPKVSVIGEFWAMTTEGDGNYGLQRFLEQEGAEVDIQIVTNWLLYNVWEHVRHQAAHEPAQRGSRSSRSRPASTDQEAGDPVGG
jgi:predicted nucleotide-binding protein (sugar kinase/HSP70/actin superfamily)